MDVQGGLAPRADRLRLPRSDFPPAGGARPLDARRPANHREGHGDERNTAVTKRTLCPERASGSPSRRAAQPSRWASAWRWESGSRPESEKALSAWG